MSEADDLPRGLPLLDAVRQWSDPASWERLRNLPVGPARRRVVHSSYLDHPPRLLPPSDTALRRERERIEARLRWDFSAKLRSGELVATGLEAPLTVTSRRIVVARHLWEALRPRFSTSSAEGGGLTIIQIEVFEASALASSGGAGGNSQLSPARDDPPQIRLSDDDSVFTIAGEEMVIGGSIQQAILRQLVDAFQGNKRLRTADVLAHAGSNADSLKKAFRGSPHWQTLSGVLRQKNGYSWLELLDKPITARPCPQRGSEAK